MNPLKRCFVFYLILVAVATNAQSSGNQIQLNQLGFLSGLPKIAVITGKTGAQIFYISSPDHRDTFYRGTLSAEKQSQYSSTTTRLADFSLLKRKGSYVVLVPGIGSSIVFHIADNVYNEIAKAVIKGFYYQRSDEALLPRHAGKWSRPAGHPDTSVLIHPSAASTKRPQGLKISSPKGWYDAGDYNKYIVNSGITMGTLLSAYEDFPSYFHSLRINIPESNDAVPDILNEALYNLRWMLSMQDPNDGGVYHKCTNAFFDGLVMPGVTKDPRYVVQKSTPAALDFAAVTAQAARIFRKFQKQLPGLADSCLTASVQAWNWALKNPELRYNQRQLNEKFDPDISTGEYSGWPVNDEWFWASAELLITTKEAAYYHVVQERLKDPVSLPSWGNVAMLGYFSLNRMAKLLPSFAKAIVPGVKDSILKIADQYLINIPHNAFATVMGQSRRDFNWGGNAVAANQGMLLLNAYLITRDRKYFLAAATNLDYLLGRNATGYCFVTGFGQRSPMHPHHRPSAADGIDEPVPGLLVGGPNPGMQDKCNYPFTEPETAYLDEVCSYASNEIAINWNAPAVYLFNAVNALR